MAAKSKQKGSAFERDICRMLSLWITNGKRKDVFWRSAMSGGRATLGRNRGESIRQSGDITAVAPEGHGLTDVFYIECKFYKDLNITSFFLTEKGTLAAQWRQTCKEAASHKKKPMLIAKQNQVPTLVVLGRNLYFAATQRDTETHIDNRACSVCLLEDLLTTGKRDDKSLPVGGKG